MLRRARKKVEIYFFIFSIQFTSIKNAKIGLLFGGSGRHAIIWPRLRPEFYLSGLFLKLNGILSTPLINTFTFIVTYIFEFYGVAGKQN